MTASTRARLRVMSVLGLALSAWPLLLSDDRPALAAITASWLFVTGIAFGCIVLSAISEVTGAHFSDLVRPACERAAGLLPLSFATLLALSLLAPRFLPWVNHPVDTGRTWWLNLPAFYGRTLIGGLALFGSATAYVKARSQRRPARREAILFLIAFVVVTTIWSVDFILALDPEWVSPLIGAFYFMGSFLGGVAIAALMAASPPRVALRHDLGKLLFGFCVFWTYLLFTQVLVIWYGDLPEDTGFLIERRDGAWGIVAIVSVVLVFLIPFVVLMRESAKRDTRVLAFCAALVLCGLWLMTQLLVVPSLAPELTPAVASAALGSTLFFGTWLAVMLSTRAQIQVT
jgi:hypothetical protein